METRRTNCKYNRFLILRGKALFNAAGWILISAAQNGGSGIAGTVSDFNNPVQCDRWLVTPQVAVPASTPNVVLQWVASSEGTKTIRIVMKSCCLRLIQPAHHSLLTFFGTTENPYNTTHILPLASYAGQTIRIAFRDTTTNGILLFLNSIKIVNLPSDAASIYDVEIYEHNYLTNPVTVQALFSKYRLQYFKFIYPELLGEWRGCCHGSGHRIGASHHSNTDTIHIQCLSIPLQQVHIL